MRSLLITALLVTAPLGMPGPALSQHTLTAPTDPAPEVERALTRDEIRTGVLGVARVIAALALVYLTYLVVGEIHRRRKMDDIDHPGP